jgi:ketosteroid isomerase-like protein
MHLPTATAENELKTKVFSPRSLLFRRFSARHLSMSRADTTLARKAEIRSAFVRIAEYFNHSIVVRQGNMVVIEGGDTALVISETLLGFVEKNGSSSSITRRATYVFRKGSAGQWLCAIDNSYGAIF